MLLRPAGDTDDPDSAVDSDLLEPDPARSRQLGPEETSVPVRLGPTIDDDEWLTLEYGEAVRWDGLRYRGQSAGVGSFLRLSVKFGQLISQIQEGTETPTVEPQRVVATEVAYRPYQTGDDFKLLERARASDCDPPESGSCIVGVENATKVEVAASQRGKGIGKTILSATFGHLREAHPKLAAMFLFVFEDNVRAKALYEKSKFVEVLDFGLVIYYARYDFS
ncbi:hypothetical protein FOZ60_015232 [Perkinsus olseni]|uniref:N-acetyltransferase domain-containing protein n=1 Tax=Perkinsus olseni TaxID=32597 RepID=A0A7J6N750_PEROL|nr:hypothetical protein FOZ60_015232 [Perkinsus olseni]